jgi:predicted nucleic acid-binding protein
VLNASELIPELDFTPAPISRDPKDDYLLAHALLEAADFIVSGDRDLLALASISPIKIVSPAEFARILDDIQIVDD